MSAWMTRALCGPDDTDWVDAAPLGRQRLTADARRKIEICAVCPVKLECLDLARELHPTAGIFGGTTPVDREGWPIRFDTGYENDWSFR